jgi:uracil-DNA glycosylase
MMPEPARYSVTLDAPDDFDGWRDAARRLASHAVAPANVVWSVVSSDDLFAEEGAELPPMGLPFSVSKPFVQLAQSAILHSEPERFALLYTLLLRVRADPRAITDRADPLVRRIEELAKAIRRDSHKMHAFVRFREIDEADGTRFVAWFEPDHHIVRANAGFFVRRFANMRWSILTPEVCIHWDGEVLTESPGATRADAPDGDPVEDLWKRYYASTFNPARVKIGAMMKEMPKKYWKNMPETALIPELVAAAQGRESTMISAPSAPSDTSLDRLREEAMHCQRCPLWKPATQTVFGEGPADAKLMLVGEQPGDQEDMAGHPFVGPAGQMLDRALIEAGIDRSQIYITNAVKHFKYEPRGKRRIHARPNTGEIIACRWWIDQERAMVQPEVVVALGATAAHSLLGKAVTIKATRETPTTLSDGSRLHVTIHPSYLLRLEDAAAAQTEYARFVADLRSAAAHVSG